MSTDTPCIAPATLAAASETAHCAYDFAQVDVFAEAPLEGNALAVFADARGLSPSEMQALARETNLSETTFILPRAPEIEQERGVQAASSSPQKRSPSRDILHSALQAGCTGTTQSFAARSRSHSTSASAPFPCASQSRGPANKASLAP